MRIEKYLHYYTQTIHTATQNKQYIKHKKEKKTGHKTQRTTLNVDRVGDEEAARFLCGIS
jgi:hypothetical protein